MSNQPVLNVKISDGRFARSQKTKDAIVKALLKLLNDTPFPTAEQVARESKIGLRTVYRQFKDMESIYLSLHEECLSSLEKMFKNEIDVNKSFEETTLKDCQDVYSTNVFSVAMLIKKVIKFMSATSNVVNISSIGGVQGSVKFSGLSAYSSSKAALNILTEMLAEEFKERKIHFNSLALGSVETKMLKKAFPDFKASTTAQEMANYIYEFSTAGYKFLNGKIVSVSSSTP